MGPCRVRSLAMDPCMVVASGMVLVFQPGLPARTGGTFTRFPLVPEREPRGSNKHPLLLPAAFNHVTSEPFRESRLDDSMAGSSRTKRS